MWKDFSPHDVTRLEQARLELHYAIQLPMRASKIILQKKPDYSHTSLDFSAKKNAFTTHNLNENNLHVGVTINDMMLYIEDDQSCNEFYLLGNTQAQASQWLQSELNKHHIGTDNFDKGGFKLPPHGIADGKKYQCCEQDAFANLAIWYHNATLLLERLAVKYADIQPGASQIYCWPHHFDLAILITFDKNNPETARSVGVGLSPGDHFFNQPYFYTNPWPANSQMNFPDLLAPGFWNLEGFISAIAKSESILEQKLGMQDLADYLEDVVAKSAKLIGAS